MVVCGVVCGGLQWFVVFSATLIEWYVRNEQSSPLSSFLAGGDFFHLLITVADSLDPDQDRHSVGPDLDPNCLSL